jgi:hypothetical protein
MKDYAVIKFGSHGDNTGRQLTHDRVFPNCRLLDSFLTNCYTYVEQLAKDRWLREGELYEGLFQGKTVRDTELLLVKRQDGYAGKTRYIQQLIAEAEGSAAERVLAAKTRLAEAETERIKWELEMMRFRQGLGM